MSSKTIYHPVGPTPEKIKNRYTKHKGYTYTPYVYLVRCIPTGQIYYGSRFAACAHPNFFFKDYFTSSKIVHKLIKVYGISQFEYQIRKTFNTMEECISWEQKVLSKMSVASHPGFINKDENQQVSINKNTKFISNQVTGECIRVKKDMIVPDGWIHGNINQNLPSPSIRKWFYDPASGNAHHVSPEEKEPHWIPGRGPNYVGNSASITGKYIQITNGEDNKLLPATEEIPCGWYRGRTKTESERKNNAIANSNTTGCIYINDGTVTKRLAKDSPIPDGWVKGNLTLQKLKASRNSSSD